MRGSDLEAHLLFIVEGRYLGGYASRHARQLIILPQELATKYGDLRYIVTDQGAPFYRSTQDGDALPRQFYLSLRQIVADLQALLAYKSSIAAAAAAAAPPSTSENQDGGDVVASSATSSAILTVASATELLELEPSAVLKAFPQSLPVFEALQELVNSHASQGVHTPQGSVASGYVLRLLETDAHAFFCAPGLRLLSDMLQWAPLRKAVMARMEALISTAGDVQVQHQQSDAAAAATEGGQQQQPSNSSNAIESVGYGWFKQFMIHPYSVTLALQIFGGLPLSLRDDSSAGTAPRGRTVEEAQDEVRIFCKGFELYGFEAVCGNLGGATLAALLGRFAQGGGEAGGNNSVSGGEQQNNYRKRGRDEDQSSSTAVAVVENADVLQHRAALIRSTAVSFTQGIEDGSHTIRISALSRHVLACRSVQCILGGFLSLVSNSSDSTSSPEDHLTLSMHADMSTEARVSYRGRSLAFVEALCRNAAILMVDNYGNYVMQTLVLELCQHIAKSATGATTTATPITTSAGNNGEDGSNNDVPPQQQPTLPTTTTLLLMLLRLFQETIEVSLGDIAMNKCGSNCVEKFVLASEYLTKGGPSVRAWGDKVVVSLSETVVRLGGAAFGQLAAHQFGNYAMRQLLTHLSGVATSNEASPEIRARAQACEINFHQTLMSLLPRLEGNMYATGVRGWFQQHSARLNARGGR